MIQVTDFIINRVEVIFILYLVALGHRENNVECELSDCFCMDQGRSQGKGGATPKSS